MKDWKKTLIYASTSIMQALKIIDEEALQVAVVIKESGRLQGIVTDGDVRRGLLRGISLDQPVELIMNTDPIYVRLNEERGQVFALMKRKRIYHVPVVDQNYIVVGLELLSNLLQPNVSENRVVLMAGGMGTRLSPLTNNCPKPLLRVGNKPILETILENFYEYGFRKFYISVNYKADMIEEYFGDGQKWGVEISYLRERERLGTAGALSLLPEQVSSPLLVMNGDLLTKVNFQQLLEFHIKHSAMATMCVRDYNFQVPYGVVDVQDHQIMSIVEKPVQRFFVSAGIYVLAPSVLRFIPSGTYFDMPTLFEQIVKSGYTSSAFPVREYWMDIGRMPDFEKANIEFSEMFYNIRHKG